MENCIIIQAKTFEKAKKELSEIKKKNPKKIIGFTSTDDDLNRKILEKIEVSLFMPLLFRRKDWQKQRNSGLDQVMAKIAKKKNIILGISFKEIISSNQKEKPKILSRVMQNIALCKKYKVKMSFIGSDKNPHDLQALGLVLGMPTWMTKTF